jgi:cyclopropane fatty-acyl-phospholipid synthase-like methyltransferase
MRRSIQEVARFYDAKTATILSRYGPGPRIHYHTGIIEQPITDSDPVDRLCQTIVLSQERALEYSAEHWRVGAGPFSEVLDVGCGLGGGAIFWAQRFNARVTAITIAPSHIELVRRFAADAGVGSRILPVLCAAEEMPGTNCFDAAIAIDSSSSLSRGPWFHRLAELLRPSGRLFIYDCFVESPEFEEPFNRHWFAQIGTFEEYFAVAREAGFRPDLFEDISSLTRYFWTATMALLRAEATSRSHGLDRRASLCESLRIHEIMHQGLASGGLRYAIMSFVRH